MGYNNEIRGWLQSLFNYFFSYYFLTNYFYSSFCFRGDLELYPFLLFFWQLPQILKIFLKTWASKLFLVWIRWVVDDDWKNFQSYILSTIFFAAHGTGRRARDKNLRLEKSSQFFLWCWLCHISIKKRRAEKLKHNEFSNKSSILLQSLEHNNK